MEICVNHSKRWLFNLRSLGWLATIQRRPAVAEFASGGVGRRLGFVALNSDNPLVVAPFIIASLCCTILFMRLRIGSVMGNVDLAWAFAAAQVGGYTAASISSCSLVDVRCTRPKKR